MKDRVEIIARTERRRKFSDAEKAAILAEADADGVSVRQVAEHHEIAGSLIYNWRSARRQAAAIASEALEFIPYGAIITADPVPAPVIPEPQKAQRPVSSPMPPAPEELIRPHPGTRPGAIDIDLPSGVRLSVDSYVNEKALARVLRAFQDVS
ncbi:MULTISPECIES: transposase [unclassified Novosphingobium]|uniref:IS66-like element accessory protein TnpA n=1 Tax=unclassified Novosphingobium TaxID=2644732 RepID=UPI00135AC690|nr:MULTISPECIES: transposase [unclassified Novosphingobium]